MAQERDLQPETLVISPAISVTEASYITKLKLRLIPLYMEITLWHSVDIKSNKKRNVSHSEYWMPNKKYSFYNSVLHPYLGKVTRRNTKTASR